MWLGNTLNPEQWGWAMNDNILEPVTTLLPPAPEELLNMIFCNCTKGCSTNCGCRKIGVSCSIICGHCRGQSCFNSSSSNGLDENIDDIDNPNKYEGINLLDCLAEENDADEHQNNEEQDILMQDMPSYYDE